MVRDVRPHWLWGPAGALLYAAIVAGVLFFRTGAVPAACAAAEGKPVEARFLVVGAVTDTTVAAWTATLRNEGVPFLRVDPRDVATVPLVAPDGVGRFIADVIVSPEVLTTAANARLSAYEQSYGARRVYSRLDRPLAGLAVPGVQQDLGGRVAVLTAAGTKVFPYLRGPVPIDADPGRLAVAGPGVTPLLTLGGRTLVATLRRPDGVDELAVTVGAGPKRIHSLLLAPGLIAWAANGALTSSWTPFLTVHVDDILLPSFTWIAKLHSSGYAAGILTPSNLGEYTVRMTADDVRYAAAWERRQHFTLDLGLNGFALGGDCGPLVRAVVSARNDFRWFNHTFQHLNLDETSTKVDIQQISENLSWAKARGIPLRSWELVTGEHSGLDNPAIVPAFAATGIRVFGSDASRRQDPYRLGPATALPREPMNIFQDAATRAQELSEFNWRVVAGPGCTTSGCLPEPLTWAEFRTREARRVLGLVLANNPRPSYAHESNLAEDRILLDVLGLTLAEYRHAVKTPIAQPDMTAALRALQRRLAWERAVSTGKARVVRRGTTLVLTSSVAVEAPVTVPGKAVRWYALTPDRARTVPVP